MAGTVTFTHQSTGPVRRIAATCTGDASDGTVPATALPKFEGRVLAFRTNPASPAPTDDYDVTLIDADGLDRLQGVGANRDQTNSEEVPVVHSGTSQHPSVDRAETLTLTVANQSVASAVFVVTITYEPS